MGTGNFWVYFLAAVFIVLALSFITLNAADMFRRRTALIFVTSNVLNILIFGAALYPIYLLDVGAICKFLSCIIIFNSWLFGCLSIRYIIFTNIVDNMVIQDGVLLKVQASSEVERIRVPSTCHTIAIGAIANFEKLNELILPKTITRFSDESIVNCPNLTRIVFENKDIQYSGEFILNRS